jgi:hypothetical protein
MGTKDFASITPQNCFAQNPNRSILDHTPHRVSNPSFPTARLTSNPAAWDFAPFATALKQNIYSSAKHLIKHNLRMSKNLLSTPPPLSFACPHICMGIAYKQLPGRPLSSFSLLTFHNCIHPGGDDEAACASPW